MSRTLRSMGMVLFLTILSTACQSIVVNPRLRQVGQGLERYRAVSITCDGITNTTVVSALSVSLKKIGYEVVAGPADLNLMIHVKQSTEPSYPAQVAMVAVVGWNWGLGDAQFEATGSVIEASSSEELLRFTSSSGANTNYYATVYWVNNFVTEWQRHRF